MSETAYLALLLDGPFQSWGFASRFQRRTTGLYPTKSGVAGLICAAMGLTKGSDEERRILPALADSKMTVISIPREAQEGNGNLPVRRMEDYHTTGGGYDNKTQPLSVPRRASGGPADPTVSYREYLLDARFGVILEGVRPLLERVYSKLEDPVWGVWLGRKNCIPAQPIPAGLFGTQAEAELRLVGDRPIADFTTVTEADAFREVTDSWLDQPVSFGDGSSSGLDTRQFAVRHVTVRPGAVERGPGPASPGGSGV